MRAHTAQPQADGDPGVPTVAERVLAIVADELGLAEGDVTPASRFTEDLGADSLDRIELSISLEDAFGLIVPDADATQFQTVADAIAWVEQRVGHEPHLVS